MLNFHNSNPEKSISISTKKINNNFFLFKTEITFFENGNTISTEGIATLDEIKSSLENLEINNNLNLLYLKKTPELLTFLSDYCHPSLYDYSTKSVFDTLFSSLKYSFNDNIQDLKIEDIILVDYKLNTIYNPITLKLINMKFKFQFNIDIDKEKEVLNALSSNHKISYDYCLTENYSFLDLTLDISINDEIFDSFGSSFNAKNSLHEIMTFFYDSDFLNINKLEVPTD